MREERLRVVIGDDEAASRLRLRQMLARRPDVELVAECPSGPATIEAVRRERPSVVFLDVQMPGCDGFAVLAQLGSWRPAVVFITAHEQYAVRAFDVQACDYLLKPFDDGRFDRSLARARAHLASAGDRHAGLPGVASARLALASQARSSPRLAIQDGKVMRFLDMASITHLTAEDCYTRIHVADRTFLVREAISSLVHRLPGDWFCRIHRSTAINITYIDAITAGTHGDLSLRLAGREFRVSRRYRDAIARLRSASRPG